MKNTLCPERRIYSYSFLDYIGCHSVILGPRSIMHMKHPAQVAASETTGTY